MKPRSRLPPLYRWAASHGAKASIEFYVRKGHDVNATDTSGRTLLLLAAAEGYADICRLLIEAGADPSLHDVDGLDALSAAVKNENKEAEAVLRGYISSRAVSGGEPAAAHPSAADGVSDAHAAAAAPEEEISNLADWEELVEPPVPPDDPSLLSSAREQQNKISIHIPINTDRDWSDVQIDLPDGTELHSLEHAAWLDEVRDLVRCGLSCGWVTSYHVSQVVQNADNENSADEIEFRLRVLLGEIGVLIEDDPDIPESVFIARLRSHESSEDRYNEIVEDSIAFLGDLSRSHDPFSHYVKDVTRTALLSRDEEIALAERIENGTNETYGAIAHSRPALLQVLEWTDQIEHRARSGQVFPEVIVGADEDGTTDQAAGATAFLAGAQAIRRILENEPSKFAGSGPENTLRDILVSLGLSDVGIRLLWVTVSNDTSNPEACRMLTASLCERERARNEFAEANLRLVMWCARQQGGLPLMDRIQEGNIGLFKAIDRFDPRHGTKFSTYATWWIRQGISRAVADQGRLIRLPVHMWELTRKVQKAVDTAVARTGRIPEETELARELDVQERAVRNALAAQKDAELIGIPEISPVVAGVETPVEPEFASAVVMKDTVHKVLRNLKPREADVVRLRFGLGSDADHTLQDVGEMLGLTRERIRQIESAALRKLRKILSGDRSTDRTRS